MLKNEVGNDGAATAVEKATRNENLLSEFSSALSDSTALKVAVGTAALAAGAVATVAAIKYARPALEAGKAIGAVADEGALAGVRAAVNDGNLAPKAVSSISDGKTALLESSTPINRSAGNNPFSKALQVDEASITRHEIGHRTHLTPAGEPSDAVKTYLQDFGHPANFANYGRIDAAAVDALLEGSIPISAATRDAAAKTLAPATEELVKNSIPITKAKTGFEPFPFFGMSDDLAARMEFFGVPLKGELPGLDAAAVLRGKPLGHELVPASAHVDKASILAHEVGHRTGLNAPLFPSLNDLRALKESSGLFRNKIPMTERLGFKEVDPKIPMFPTMDDIVKLMPESGPNMNRVVMNLDGVARDVSVTDAVSILGERAVKFIASNPKGAAKALADRMPKPASESDVTALAAKMTQRLDPVMVNEAVAKATKGA